MLNKTHVYFNKHNLTLEFHTKIQPVDNFVTAALYYFQKHVQHQTH